MGGLNISSTCVCVFNEKNKLYRGHYSDLKHLFIIEVINKHRKKYE